jgi:Tfp pilus assembly protein FimT
MFLLKRPQKKQLGQSTTEYALTLAIIALLAIGAIYVFGTWNSNQMNSAADSISGGISAGQGGGGGANSAAGNGGQGTTGHQTGGGGAGNSGSGGASSGSGSSSGGDNSANNNSGGAAGSVSNAPTPVTNKKQN